MGTTMNISNRFVDLATKVSLRGQRVNGSLLNKTIEWNYGTLQKGNCEHHGLIGMCKLAERAYIMGLCMCSVFMFNQKYKKLLSCIHSVLVILMYWSCIYPH